MYTLNLADKEAGSFSQSGQLQKEYEPTSPVVSEWNVSPVRHREAVGPFQPVFRDAEIVQY